MSSLWSERPSDFHFCATCSGTGKVRCSSCSGTGSRYETRYEYDYEGRSVSRLESVSCGRCGGSGDQTCPRCGGSGGTLKTGSARSRASYADDALEDDDELLGPYGDDLAEEDEEVVDPYAGQTEGELRVEMERDREGLLYQIHTCPRLPTRLRDRWLEWLSGVHLTRPEAEAELKALRDEVKARAREYPYGLMMVSHANDLESSLNLIEVGISSLEFDAGRFQRRFRA
jgi:hypothetical protein